MKQVQSNKANPQTQCEVCRAAAALVRASDVLRNAGRLATTPMLDAFALADENWTYARGQRHTGTAHPPVLDTTTSAPTSPAAAVLADREQELLTLKGPCSNRRCRLHYAHSGPCHTVRPPVVAS